MSLHCVAGRAGWEQGRDPPSDSHADLRPATVSAPLSRDVLDPVSPLSTPGSSKLLTSAACVDTLSWRW